jgi:hypothetical protein
MFLMLMVGALGSLASPPMGPTVDVSCIDGGRSQISVTTSQGGHCRYFLRWWWAFSDLRHRFLGGPLCTFLSVDGRRSWISITASEGARHRYFLHKWWAFLDLRHHLPEGPSLTFLALMVGALGSLASPPRGGHRQCFLALMVGAPRSPSPPPRGPTINISCIDCVHSQISGIAFLGARRRCPTTMW